MQEGVVKLGYSTSQGPRQAAWQAKVFTQVEDDYVRALQPFVQNALGRPPWAWPLLLLGRGNCNS
jgi:hypothetical protein